MRITLSDYGSPMTQIDNAAAALAAEHTRRRSARNRFAAGQFVTRTGR